MSQPDGRLSVEAVTPLSGVQMSPEESLLYKMPNVLAGLAPIHSTGLPNADFHQLNIQILGAFSQAEGIRRQESRPELRELLKNSPRVSANAAEEDPLWESIVESLEATNSGDIESSQAPVVIAAGGFPSVFGSLAVGSELVQPDWGNDENYENTIDAIIETEPATSIDPDWQDLVESLEDMPAVLGLDTKRATTINPVWQNLVKRLEATSSQASDENTIDVTIETEAATSIDPDWQDLVDELEGMKLSGLDTKRATSKNRTWKKLVKSLKNMPTEPVKDKVTELGAQGKVEQFPGWSSRRDRLVSMYADHSIETTENDWRDRYDELVDPHVSRLQRLQELREDQEAFNIGLNTVAITFAKSTKFKHALKWMSTENADNNAVDTAFVSAIDPEMRQEVWAFISERYPVIKRLKAGVDQLPYRHVHFVMAVRNKHITDAVEAGASSMVFAALAEDGVVSAFMTSLVVKKELANNQ